MGLKTPWGGQFVALEGTYCGTSDKHRCDGAGNCVEVKSRKVKGDDKSRDALWWTLTILAVVLLSLVFLFLYLLRKQLTR
ncbi:hypothetical protein CEXT_152421 [Caerostris extrusa]|uniref:Uncharacterized protein n=1 Tax=Caerostris extrusa TaxID=172846 RepID=A0AAV4WNE1_CAEEX|nr:hypothetical protein CEXT_152421 [Caerostris extrusa]